MLRLRWGILMRVLNRVDGVLIATRVVIRRLLLMDLLDLGRIIVGLVLLVLGGEVLVRGASALARRAGVSSLVVGLTVVSAATSAPELSVSIGAVLRDEPGLAVGNVVGSNIANVLLILGLSALVLPLAATQRLVRFDPRSTEAGGVRGPFSDRLAVVGVE